MTSRTEAKRAAAVKLGADRAFETGSRLPERVDVVMETVGAHIAAALWPDTRWSPENQVVVHPCDVNVGRPPGSIGIELLRQPVL